MFISALNTESIEQSSKVKTMSSQDITKIVISIMMLLLIISMVTVIIQKIKREHKEELRRKRRVEQFEMPKEPSDNKLIKRNCWPYQCDVCSEKAIYGNPYDNIVTRCEKHKNSKRKPREK